MYLRIGESLGLRGPEIDKLNNEAMEAERSEIAKKALADLKAMTLTVIDGNFPREVLANQDLSFTSYTMPSRRNKTLYYDANEMGPGKKKQGTVTWESVSVLDSSPKSEDRSILTGMILLSCVALGVVFYRRRSFRLRDIVRIPERTQKVS